MVEVSPVLMIMIKVSGFDDTDKTFPLLAITPKLKT